jgi:hypothetical protein
MKKEDLVGFQRKKNKYKEKRQTKNGQSDQLRTSRITGI